LSLHYYPHEDFHVRPAASPEGSEPHAGDWFPISIIDLTLAMAAISFAVNGRFLGASVVLVLTAGFNVLALRGKH
jgi:hypothetical protein